MKHELITFVHNERLECISHHEFNGMGQPSPETWDFIDTRVTLYAQVVPVYVTKTCLSDVVLQTLHEP